MNNGRPQEPSPAPSALRGHDILYVLYRHKLKIVVLSLAGLIAGAVVFFTSKPAYISEAELLVKYVVENRTMAVDGTESTVRTPFGPGGDSVIYSEIGILTSMDLARDVAQEVGPTNIVSNLESTKDPLAAATAIIHRGLQVSAAPKSSILQVRFQHGDPAVARAVLTNVVAGYLRMHARIHRSLDVLDDLQREADQRRIALDQVATELRRIKNDLRVASVEDAKRAYQDEIARTRKEISVAETLLAEKRAALAILGGLATPKAEPSTNSDAVAVLPVPTPVPPARVAEHRNLRLRIEDLMRKEQTLLLEYTELSPFVQAVRQRLATNQASLEALESEYPALATSAPAPVRGIDPVVAVDRGPSPALEIPGIEARLKSLQGQLEDLRSQAQKLDERDEELESLTRRKEIEEKRYIHLVTSLSQAGIDQALTQGRTANIRVIQQPTPAARVQSTVLKLAGGLAAGGVALALALAFGYDWYADTSIRRRNHVEDGLKVPLFLSIPRLRLPKPRKTPKAIPRTTGSATGGPSDGGGSHGGGDGGGDGDPDSSLDTYVEALRDRLIMHFETEGLERKPKLVGLTSCGHGAGVTTLATRLASSLSETGDGNVLYVDMNPHRGPSLLPFQRGESKVALAEAFEGETRAAALVQDNLYVVSLTEPGSRRVGVVPKTLAALMPKMKASDYDYIIFDFPPVTQTSVTAKVTGLLDMTFLVVESERTQTDLAKNALALMGKGHAKVSAVLNKHRRYLPPRLDPDL